MGKTKKNGKNSDLEFYYEIKEESKSKSRQGQKIFLGDKKNLQFVCSYSLAMQTIDSESKVTGGQFIISRASVGNLGNL